MDDEEREFQEWREFQAQRAARQNQQVQPIELTGKKWKAMILIGVVLMVFGVLLTCSGAMGRNPGSTWSSLLPVGVLAAGLYLTVVGKVGAWWYHK